MPGISANELRNFYESQGKSVSTSLSQSANAQTAVQYNYAAFIQAKKDGLNVTPEQFGLGLSNPTAYANATPAQQFLSDFYNNKGTARADAIASLSNPYGLAQEDGSGYNQGAVQGIQNMPELDDISAYKPVPIDGSTNYNEINAARGQAVLNQEPIPTVDGGFIGSSSPSSNRETTADDLFGSSEPASLTPSVDDTFDNSRFVGPRQDVTQRAEENLEEEDPKLPDYANLLEDVPQGYLDLFDDRTSNDFVDPSAPRTGLLGDEKYITSSFLEAGTDREGNFQGSNAIYQAIHNIEIHQEARNNLLNQFNFGLAAEFESDAAPSTLTYNATLGRCVSRQANGSAIFTDD